MIKQTKKAFTLIELLVVIAIIGILAGIVIVNLNSARNKGQDTAIKAQANQLVSTSAVYYDDNGYGYSTGAFTAVSNANCSVTGALNASFSGTFFADSNAIRAITGVLRNSGFTPKCSMGGSTVKAQSWAVTAKLRNSPGYWCIDSTGTGVELAAASNGNIVVTGSEVSCQ
jgi:prepilin-type N-terminal cleavage/methylation domain-containing protein